MEHDFLAQFPAKMTEYLLSLAYLVAFLGLWRYVNPEKAKRVPATVPAGKKQEPFEFEIPEGVWLHPGHSWARLSDDLATIGIDDFGRRLVGDIETVELPRIGQQLRQGEPAWRFTLDGRTVEMLSPVDGVVIEQNARVARDPQILRDPYGEGWIAKVRPTRATVNKHQLLFGRTATYYEREAFEQLLAKASPDIGRVAHDGGVAVNGLAQAISPENWDTLVRSQFLTEERS